MLKVKSFALRWGPVLFWMAVIFLASGTPGSDLPTFGTWDYVVKKGGHMLGYAVLAVLVRRGIGWERRPVAAAWLPAIIYALVDEVHQSFVPGRHPALTDALGFDGVGAALGLLMSWLVERPETKRPSPERRQIKRRDGS